MDWKSNTVAELFKPLKASPFTRDELNSSGGEYLNVHYGDILVKFPSVVDVDKEGLPFVNATSEAKCGRCSLLQDGDIIIADTAEDEAVGKAIEIQGTSGKKVISGLHTIAYRPQEGVFAPGFLGYFLNSSVYHNQLLPLMQGIKVLSITKTALSDTLIKYPVYEDQARITKALLSIDALIARLDEAIEKKGQIKRGLMQSLLTGNTRLRHNEEWEVFKLSQVGEMFAGGTPSTEIKDYWDGEVSWLHSGAIQNCYLYPCNVQRKITTKGLQNSAARIIKAGSVLVAITGATCANIGFLTFQSAANQSVIAIETRDGFDALFLYYKLLASRNQILSHKGGSAQSGVTLKSLSSVEVFLPTDINEQREIAKILRNCDLEIIALENKRDKYILIKQGMMQQLLTGKIRLA